MVNHTYKICFQLRFEKKKFVFLFCKMETMLYLFITFLRFESGPFISRHRLAELCSSVASEHRDLTCPGLNPKKSQYFPKITNNMLTLNNSLHLIDHIIFPGLSYEEVIENVE